MKLHLRYGREGLEVEIPDRNLAHVLRMNETAPLAEPVAAVREACASPLGTPPLREVVRGHKSACLALSDRTRPVPNALLLGPVLEALNEEGVAPGDILLLIATGLHRPPTRPELREMLGEEILGRGYRIESHFARDSAAHVDLGELRRGHHALVDRRWVEAELRVIVSLVEPHLTAGYSGGRKMVLPGLCSAETIMRFHCPTMVEDELAYPGSVGANPVDQEARELAALAGGADFILCCTLDEERRMTSIHAGDLGEAHLAGMEQAERQAKVVLDEPVDICVTSNAGYPLDLTFYQGIKAAWAGYGITRPGGTVIIAHECAEGLGGPEFSELLLSCGDPHEFVRCALAEDRTQIDQWALHQYEKPLRARRIMSYCTGIPREVQQQLCLESISSVEEGIAWALAEHGPDARIAVIPEGPYVLPCLRDSRLGRMSVREMMEEEVT